jgi:hypothetical protein
MDSWKGTCKPAATCNKPMTSSTKPAQAAGSKAAPTAKKPTGKK